MANIIAVSVMTKFAAAIRSTITATNLNLYFTVILTDILVLNLKSTLAARKAITLMKYLKSAIILLRVFLWDFLIFLKELMMLRQNM